jgi:hypothetical protein
MAREEDSYLLATRHPWPCLIFLVPLLVAYEAGVLWLGAAEPDLLRNGADAWTRGALETFGLHQLYWAPALIVVLFIGWSWARSHDRPAGLANLWTGMAFESILFALALWGVSLGLGRLLQGLGIELSTAAAPEQALAQVVTFVGAGIYEELLFRLLLYSALAFLLRKALLPPAFAVFLAASASGTLFAAAHHIGPRGEAFDGYVFLFRSVAGLYFALLYELRGFGIAVGAHACYDILVGVAVG